jgi:hypothetical protein
VNKSDFLPATLGALAAAGAHVACGLLVANVAWVGRDSPAEWTFYYTSGGCCLLPLTGTLAWLLIRNAKTKRVGQGAAIGLLAVTVLALVALLTGYAPAWVSEGWTSEGWT